MALTTSNLLAHAPELHGSDQKDDPETKAADSPESSPATTPTEMKIDDESTLEQEVGDRPISPLNTQTTEPVQLLATPQKKLIPNLETTFGGISFLAILITPILLWSFARKK